MKVDMVAVRRTIAYWHSLTETQKSARVKLAHKRAARNKARRAAWRQ